MRLSSSVEIPKVLAAEHEDLTVHLLKVDILERSWFGPRNRRNFSNFSTLSIWC